MSSGLCAWVKATQGAVNEASLFGSIGPYDTENTRSTHICTLRHTAYCCGGRVATVMLALRILGSDHYTLWVLFYPRCHSSNNMATLNRTDLSVYATKDDKGILTALAELFAFTS